MRTNCIAELVTQFIEIGKMDFYRQIAPIKWLAVGAVILAMVGCMVESAASEPAMAELDCRYDLMTGGRMCDCENRDEVMKRMDDASARAYQLLADSVQYGYFAIYRSAHMFCLNIRFRISEPTRLLSLSHFLSSVFRCAACVCVARVYVRAQ